MLSDIPPPLDYVLISPRHTQCFMRTPRTERSFRAMDRGGFLEAGLEVSLGGLVGSGREWLMTGVGVRGAMPGEGMAWVPAQGRKASQPAGGSMWPSYRRGREQVWVAPGEQWVRTNCQRSCSLLGASNGFGHHQRGAFGRLTGEAVPCGGGFSNSYSEMHFRIPRGAF